MERASNMRVAIVVSVFLLAAAPGAFAQNPYLTSDPRVQLGLVTQQELTGADLFFNETFQGNGRTCGTCHPALDNFIVDPATAQRLATNNPIFAPNVPGLELPNFIRSNALILENLDGFNAPTIQFTMRAIPHVFSMSATIAAPAGAGGDRTGWGGDGAPIPRQLRDFATGAVKQHFTKTLARATGDFRPPVDFELNAIDAFMRGLGRTADIDIEKVYFNDYAASRGKVAFSGSGRCNLCHFNAGANAVFDGRNNNFNTGVNTQRTAGTPSDDGLGTPGDGTFNVPSLIEAVDTPPFFHTNNSKTIEDAIKFYTSIAFITSPAGQFLNGLGTPIFLSTEEISDIGVMLRTLNASFNLALAQQRVDAAETIDAQMGKRGRAVSNALLRAAAAEVADALRVLPGAARRACGEGAGAALLAMGHDTGRARSVIVRRAQRRLAAAQLELTTGLKFELGHANLAIPVN